MTQLPHNPSATRGPSHHAALHDKRGQRRQATCAQHAAAIALRGCPRRGEAPLGYRGWGQQLSGVTARVTATRKERRQESGERQGPSISREIWLSPCGPREKLAGTTTSAADEGSPAMPEDDRGSQHVHLVPSPGEQKLVRAGPECQLWLTTSGREEAEQN